MSSFANMVMAEIKHIREKTNEEVSESWHHHYGLVKEELEEFWEIVRMKSKRRNNEKALLELVQICARSVIAAEDLGLI